MAPSRKGKQRAAAQSAAQSATEPAWDPYAQSEPVDEEVWDPNIVWILDKIVGMEVASDGTK